MIGFYREHVDIEGLLDYEIWNASHMLAQSIPLQEEEEYPERWQSWRDFGPWENQRFWRNTETERQV